MITKEGSIKIINFMTPSAEVLALRCGHITHLMEILYFFKNLLLYSQAKIKRTKFIIMLTKVGSTIIVTFMTPWAGVLAHGRGHMSYSENTLFL